MKEGLESRVRGNAPFLVAIAVLMAVAVGLQVWRDRGWQAYEPKTPVMWLTAGPAFDRLTLGYDALVSDLYWIRTVVYFGRQRMSVDPDKNYDLLYPMLNLVTTLDPRFLVAYRFGAIFLSEPPPGGPGRRDLAVELLQRGLERNPERWEFPHDIGFVYFWSYKDYITAAQWFQRGSEVPGAPIWLKSTAAMTLARGGDRESSRMLWRQLYETAEVDWLKNSAAIRLQQFEALDAIDALNVIVWRYEARMGRPAASWQELINAGVLRRVPLDPTGEPYVLDPVNEDVRLSKKSPLWPLPDLDIPAPS